MWRSISKLSNKNIKWYLYDFDKNVTNEEKEFFGYNDGTPKKISSGILEYKKSIVQSRCEKVNKMSPYFLLNPVI